MKLCTKKSKNYGDRVVSKFLFFPKHLRNSNNGKWEIRWLEKVRVYQKYQNNLLIHWEDLFWDN